MDRIKTAFVLIKNENGEIALIQEGGKQAKGLWCLPGGHADAGETLEEAAIRETMEESGLNVKIVKKLISKEMNGGEYLGNSDENDKLIQLDIFEGKLISGELTHGSQELDARWCAKEKIENLELRWKFLKGLLIK